MPRVSGPLFGVPKPKVGTFNVRASRFPVSGTAHHPVNLPVLKDMSNMVAISTRGYRDLKCGLGEEELNF